MGHGRSHLSVCCERPLLCPLSRFKCPRHTLHPPRKARDSVCILWPFLEKFAGSLASGWPEMLWKLDLEPSPAHGGRTRIGDVHFRPPESASSRALNNRDDELGRRQRKRSPCFLGPTDYPFVPSAMIFLHTVNYVDRFLSTSPNRCFPKLLCFVVRMLCSFPRAATTNWHKQDLVGHLVLSKMSLESLGPCQKVLDLRSCPKCLWRCLFPNSSQIAIKMT